MQLVGKQFYETDYNGVHYNGVRLHVTEVRSNVEGFAVDKLNITSTKPRFNEICGIPVGSEIIPIYNKYGKVDDVQSVSKK